MKKFIKIIEDVSRRTLPPKSFDAISDYDVLKAMFEVDDLGEMFDGFWQYSFKGIPQPDSFDEIQDEQMNVLLRHYRRQIFEARKLLQPIATLSEIPINRRLQKLPDITRPAGVHWSYGIQANEDTAHRGAHILFAKVLNENVDWTTTIARAIFWWSEEKEITPTAGCNLLLTKIEFGPQTRIKA